MSAMSLSKCVNVIVAHFDVGLNTYIDRHNIITRDSSRAITLGMNMSDFTSKKNIWKCLLLLK